MRAARVCRPYGVQPPAGGGGFLFGVGEALGPPAGDGLRAGEGTRPYGYSWRPGENVGAAAFGGPVVGTLRRGECL